MNFFPAQVSSTSPGSPVFADEVTTAEVSNTTGSSLTAYLLLSSQNFVSPSGGVQISAGAQGVIKNAGAGGSSVTVLGVVDQSNQSGTAILGSSLKAPLSVSAFSGGTSYSNQTTSGSIALTSGYSIAEEIEVTLAAGAEITLDANVVVAPVSTPEPASLATMAIGLLALMGVRFGRAGRPLRSHAG